jgi:hypothetical protein
MSEPTPQSGDPNARLTNSVAGALLRNDPQLAADPQALFNQARQFSAALANEKPPFTDVDRVVNPTGKKDVFVFEQDGRFSSISLEDARKIVESGLNRDQNPAQPSVQTPQPTLTQPPPAQTPTQTQTGNIPALGGVNVNDLNINLGDFTAGIRQNPQDPANRLDAFGRLNFDNGRGFGEAGVTGTINPLQAEQVFARGGYNFGTTNVDLGLNQNLQNNVTSATFGAAYVSPDQTTQGNLRINGSTDGRAEILGSGRTPVGQDATLSGDFRFANFGTNTLGATYDGRTTDGSLRFNADAQGTNREAIGNLSTELRPGETLSGDFRFANFGTNTLGAAFDGRTTDGSLRFNADAQGTNREAIGNLSTQLRPGETLSGDFRFSNFGTNTLGATYDGRTTDGSLRFNADAQGTNREAIGNLSTELRPGETLSGDFRFGNFGTNTLGATYDGRTTDGSLRVNAAADGTSREVIGSGSTQLSATETLRGDFRFGTGADTGSLTYTRTEDQFNRFVVGGNFNTGTPGTLDTPGTPGSANVFTEVARGNAEFNYGGRLQVGTENTISAFANYQNPQNTLSASAQGQYNFNTNQGEVSGRVAYTPSNDVSVVAGVSARTNGETLATVGVNIGRVDPPAQFDQTRAQQQLDSGVADYKIAQLSGTDRVLYQDALKGVREMNEALPKDQRLPERETALSVAAAADKAGLQNIADMQLGNVGTDGKQNIFFSSSEISANPGAAPPLSIDRAVATNTSALQNLDSLASNNMFPTPSTTQSNNNTNTVSTENQELAARQITTGR